jgi:hypothetical protein
VQVKSDFVTVTLELFPWLRLLSGPLVLRPASIYHVLLGICSWYLFCFSVIVLARLCVFGIAMSIRKVFFVFLFVKVMSGRLEGIVLSVIMLRF